MNPSLSVILPVRNAQGRLANRVAALLEIVPDLTHEFEIMIVDDGSTDHTLELAQELARQYPQVQVRRHCMCHGHTASVETGLRHTTGDIVFVQDDRSSISPSQLQRLWRMRHDQRPVMAHSETGGPVETARNAQRAVRWAAKTNTIGKLDAAHGGTEMTRRGATQPSGTSADPTSHRTVDRSVRADQQVQEGAPGEGPNFLARLKALVDHEVAAYRSTRE